MTTSNNGKSNDILNDKLEDTYVSLSQQGASLIHHISTPLAIARVNVDFLTRYLDVLLSHYQATSTRDDMPTIPEEHLQAITRAPELISDQLDTIQNRVKSYWELLNKEVSGKIPDYEISLRGDTKTLDKVINQSTAAKILLVEDEAIHRDIAVKILATDYKIDTAESGEQALELCQSNHYDLILMDLYLPGMDGSKAAQEIRKTKNQHSIIVGLTNMPLGLQEDSTPLNASLSKPLSIDTLNACLKKLADVSESQ